MKTYHFSVLRLSSDKTRGEVINVGAVLFPTGEEPRVVVMASLNKLRALDATWTTQKLAAWSDNITKILASQHGIKNQVSVLARFGFCEADAVGMFTAETQEELVKKVGVLKRTYVANRTIDEQQPREKRTRLQTALRKQFSRMHVLGHTAADVANHLVVANLPVPEYPELKNDFVYKNGVYRITQTIDYNVATDGLHQKLQEACVKGTAAGLAFRAYGPDTKRYAVVDIPEAYRDATDAHIDLLLAQGFEVFQFNDAASMSEYLKVAAPLEREIGGGATSNS